MSSTRRLADEDRLEAALERGVLLDVLAVLVERRRADRAQLAAGEHRLEQVGGVDRALGGARADDRVQLVHEQDDLAAGVLDLLEDGLQALLELAAVLRAGEQRADVERDHAAVAQRLGDVAVDDALGEALDDRGLADAGLADQHRVVLRAAREDLDDAADLVVAADDRVELALARRPRVRSRPNCSSAWNLSSGLWSVTRCGPRTSSSALSDRLVRRRRCARSASPAGAVDAGEREQQVLDGDVLVLELARLAARRRAARASSSRDVARLGRRAAERGQRVERGVDVGADAPRGAPSLRSDGAGRRRRPARAARRAGARGVGLGVAALGGEPQRRPGAPPGT